MTTHPTLAISLLPPPFFGRPSPSRVELTRLVWRSDGDAHYLEGTLDGFRKRDLSVEVQGSYLEVRAERRTGLFDSEHRSFRQRVLLPAGADASGLAARFDDGRLTIRVPKLPRAKRRQIPVTLNGAPAREARPDPENLGSPVAWLRKVGSRLRHVVGYSSTQL